MTIDVNRTRKNLKGFDLKNLFIEELGWNHCANQIDINLDGNSFRLLAVAEKHGMAALICSPLSNGEIPDYAARRKIERQVAKSVHEHIIIYADVKKTTHIWQWVKREAGKPTACREHTYHVNQPGDSLIQKLQTIAFSLEHEETLNIVEVAGRTKAAFDVERITKRFYDRFKAEHDAFLKFIDGIPDDELHKWYASVMLNRLMFIYFIQKKGFMDNDDNYLRNKLLQIRKSGKNLFYKKFLCPLFFDGFAKKAKERSIEINKLLGEIPYLNGGLFLKHQIEELHGRQIEIPDKAFERLFDFFDQYQWHLDERPLKKDNEINPDVLGYIFEKYINQKQMGAYYTKEDITEYISKNTVIPFLFDSARQKCRIAFEGESSLWRLLQSDPDRYIYDAVKSGVIDKNGNIIPESVLPDFVQKGMYDPKARMFDKRYNLGEADLRDGDGNKLTLPTETWREYVERKKRCLELRAKLANGDVRDINDLITYNLNIRQFAQDVIWNSEGPELLRAFYHAIGNVTVLDPTCGSGAFLFAALNILEPLYEACLDRMQVFLDELDRSWKKHHPEKYSDFRKILKKVSEHPSLKYFIFKSIIVNNLYGVDIMEEAVEICKLRLFLKLVAQIDSVEHIEPLPDIDFNIRAGNTLVGFATYEEVRKATEGDWIKQQALPAIEEKARDVDRLFKLFHQQQTELGGEVTSEDKLELRKRLRILEDELNAYLASEYGIDVTVTPHYRENGNPVSSYQHSELVAESMDSCLGRNDKYEKWLKSHQPFHWFIEFYGILKSGGFDVIIGNPPYVEYSKIKSEYSMHKYQTEGCGNIYAYTIERSFKVVSSKGLIGLIVPLSLISTERMSSLQSLLLQESRTLWISAFDVYPCKLFEGAKQRLTILLASSQGNDKSLFISRYNRWKPEERNNLFPNLFLLPSTINRTLSVIPKIGNYLAESILKKMDSFKTASFLNNAFQVSFYVHRIPYNYVKAFDFAPYFYNEVDGEKKSEDYKTYYLHDSKHSQIMLAVLNSNLFFWRWYSLFEGYHCGKHEIQSFPIGLDTMTNEIQRKLIELAGVLMENMKSNKNRKNCWYKNTGKVVYDEFYPRKSKAIIDQIDLVLTKHYGLSEEELDYIINYDIKYRSGKDSDEDEF